MGRNKKLINNAENHLVVGSLEVLGDVSGGNIQTIKRSVENLQTSYTGLSARTKDFWSALSEDSVITPIEKIQLKKEWECIDLTYTTIYREAGNKSVLDTSTIIAYINAYNNLRTYLFTTLALFDEMTANTNIEDRDTFNTYFSNYYATENLVQTALILGSIEALDFLTVDNLEEEGTENQVVIYSGELYQWVNGVWKKIGTNGYCGCLSNLPTEIDGNYFLAAENFIGAINLVSPEWKYLIAPEGGRISCSVLYERAYIYEFVNGGWNKITDLHDYRYIVAFSDYYNLTGQLPAVWQDALDELADGLDRLEQLQQSQGTLIESYRTQILGELDAQTTSLQQQITAANGNIQTLNGKYDGLDVDLQRVLEDYYISDEETEELRAKYDFTPEEFEALQSSVSDINDDLGDLHTAFDGAVEILDDYSDNKAQIQSDIQMILRDYYVTDQELEELRAKYNFSQADFTALQNNFSTLNTNVNNVSAALTLLQTKYGVTEEEVNAMLGNLTAAEFAELISQYGSDINSLVTELAKKIEHIPVYLGLVQSVPNNAKEGDWFIWDGVQNYVWRSWHQTYSIVLQRGYCYRAYALTEWYNNNQNSVTSISWEELNPQELNNSSYYMQALDGLLTQTDVIQSQAFCVLFAGAFFAHSATLDMLKTKVIEIAAGGVIMTEDFTPNGNTGFCLNGETGKATFNDIEARGHIEATSGTFHGEIEAYSGTFMGNLTSGPFYVTNDNPSDETYTVTIPSQNSSSFVRTLRNYGYFVVDSNNPPEAGKNNISSGIITGGQFGSIFNGHVGDVAFSEIFYQISTTSAGYFSFRNHNHVEVARFIHDPFYNRISTIPEIKLDDYNPDGKTFRLLYMPTSPGVTGTVYKDSEGYLRISE